MSVDLIPEGTLNPINMKLRSDVEKCREYLLSGFEFYSEARGALNNVLIDHSAERVTVVWQKHGVEVYSFEAFVDSTKRIAAKFSDRLPV